MAHGNRMLTLPTMSRDHKRSSGDPNTLKVQYACRKQLEMPYIYIYYKVVLNVHKKKKCKKRKEKQLTTNTCTNHQSTA